MRGFMWAYGWRVLLCLCFYVVFAICDFLRAINLEWLAYVVLAAGFIVAARVVINMLAAPFEKRSTPARRPG
jgi:hypothetical protein